MKQRALPPERIRHRQFHDRAVVASLKHARERFGQFAGGKFHDRAVVASLKPIANMPIDAKMI